MSKKVKILTSLYKQIEKLRTDTLFGEESDALHGNRAMGQKGLTPIAMQHYLLAINALEQACIQFNIAGMIEEREGKEDV